MTVKGDLKQVHDAVMTKSCHGRASWVPRLGNRALTSNRSEEKKNPFGPKYAVSMVHSRGMFNRERIGSDIWVTRDSATDY